MPVEVVVARGDTVVDAILATGQIEAMQSVELRPDIEGRIAEILVREGSLGLPRPGAHQGGRRRAQGGGGAGGGGARSRPAVAHPHPRAPRAEGLEPVRAGAGGGDLAEHRGAVPAAQGPPRPDHGARAVHRSGGPADGEPGRLRHHQRRPHDAADRLAAAGRVPGARALCRAARRSGSRSPSGWRRSPAGSSPVGWTSWIRWCSCRAGRSRSRRRCRTRAASSRPACSSRSGSPPTCVPTRS